MNRYLLAAILGIAFFTFAARAEEMPKPDDRVILDLSAEDWVTTKTAHVTANVEAAVSGTNASTMRADMVKAVNDLAKADWRLTSFDRSQDQTGLERWSASFEARLPEAELGGLNDSAKKLSKAGMQLSVGDIDFSPTLEEMEATRSTIRAQIYKEANDQLTLLNTTLPGRSYRIATINFTAEEEPSAPMPRVVRGHPFAMMTPAANAGGDQAAAPSIERAQKINLNARVVFAAVAPAAASPDIKH